MWTSAAPLTLSAKQRIDLEALARSGKTPQRVVMRALIVLAASDGQPVNAIAAAHGVSRPTVYLWRRRFEEAGVLGLVKDAPRPGRRPAVSPETVAQVVQATLHTRPPDATHWSVRSMAKAQGLSPTTVHRIFRAHGLQPHRVETFKLSRDPHFVRKLRDVVGVYLHPPDKALSSASTRSRRCRPSTGRSRCCHCGRAFPPGRPTTTSGMARRICLLP